MFFPEGQVRVFLYGEPANMRLSFDGLYALARHRMQQDPLSGNLFAFINRRATQIKVLYFDRTGWCVWAKRLEQGRLISNWDAVATREMDWTQLKLLLEGIDELGWILKQENAIASFEAGRVGSIDTVANA